MYWYYKVLLIVFVVLLAIIGLTKLFTGSDKTPVTEKLNIKKEFPAKEIVEIVPKRPTQKLNIENSFSEAKNFLAKNQYENALGTYEEILNNTNKFSSDWLRSVQELSEVNTKLLNSKIPSRRKTTYSIVFGDDLFNIAKKYFTTSSAIKRSNNIKNESIIFSGQSISFFSGPWRIVIYKEKKLLLLYNKGKLFKLYSVGIGAENKTPEGQFTIYGKVVNPYWEPLGKKRIPPGDPNNILGTRWMKIVEPTGQFQGYGIHGTTEPESIGEASSQGCIRMHNADVEELFDLVPEKTKVIILP